MLTSIIVVIVLISTLLILTTIFFSVGIGQEEKFQKKREKNLLDLLEYVSKKLNVHKVEYWLDFGTLLGYYRSNGIIKGDLDCDLGIRLSNVGQLKAVKEEVISEDVVKFVTLNHLIKFYLKKDRNIMLDIYYYDFDSSKDEYLYTNESSGVIIKDSESDVFPLEASKFYNFDVQVPHNIPKLLESRYGSDYMIPKKLFHGVEHEGSYNKFKTDVCRCALTWREILKIKRPLETSIDEI